MLKKKEKKKKSANIGNHHFFSYTLSITCSIEFDSLLIELSYFSCFTSERLVKLIKINYN